jgi:hypothetical protein
LQEELRDARATRHDEAAATKEATGKTSRFFGVTWDKRERRWHAQVWRGGKLHHISYDDDEVAAARDVDKWLLANERRPVNLADDDTLLEWQTTYGSIYVGVYKNRGKWLAQIKVGDKLESPGMFHTQKEAALAYDRRARQLRNPRRGTNFRLDGTCNELGRRGKVLTQVEDEPGS